MESTYSDSSTPPRPPATARHRERHARARARRLSRVAILWLSVVATSAFAAELIVVDQAGCPYCERFEREIAPAWPNTDEGRDVPLRRVDLHAEWPADLASVAPATLTPTFILVDRGEERGRLVGYAGDDHFWFLIGRLLERSTTEASAVAAPPTDEADETASTER